MSWYVDEFFFSDCVNNKDHKINIHFLKRGVGTPFLVPKRIEKWGLPDVEYHIYQRTLDREKWGPYDEDLLGECYYIDFHAPRPYLEYQIHIDKVVNSVKKFAVKNL
jgi:hypothetical protein